MRAPPGGTAAACWTAVILLAAGCADAPGRPDDELAAAPRRTQTQSRDSIVEVEAADGLSLGKVARRDGGVGISEIPRPTAIPGEPRRLVDPSGVVFAGLARPELPRFRVVRGAVELSFDDLDLLKLMGLDPVPVSVVNELPVSLLGLDGRVVRLRGFMYPAYEERLTAFVLARDNEICCFGRDPKVYDLVPVTLAAGRSTRYIEGRPFDVVGTFRVAPKVDGDRWYRLYKIEDARIED
ncbi:MAG: hypothetical protein AAF532_15980 [Planctomycetota bacterium]